MGKILIIFFMLLLADCIPIPTHNHVLYPSRNIERETCWIDGKQGTKTREYTLSTCPFCNKEERNNYGTWSKCVVDDVSLL